jgi:hypothetical protein
MKDDGNMVIFLSGQTPLILVQHRGGVVFLKTD